MHQLPGHCPGRPRPAGTYAIKLATNAFRVYLLGRPFTIVTDHRSLEWLERLKENNARLTRWSLALQPYNFVVQY